MMRDIQVLAQIKLNLTSVDQFLAIACGLADDNPSIKDGVYGAAKEARSSTLLIDHLRNLFSHQQSIEAQAQVGHEQFNQVQAQYQTETSRTFGISLIHKQQELNNNLHNQTYNSNNNSSSNLQFANANTGSGNGGSNNIRFLDRAQFCQNSQLFTYSNQLTLVRASKCLVANVAKILYLTDTIVLRNTDQQQHHHQHHHQQPEEKLSVNPALSDRLDNVANYSQLLRCFGELSTELVDLGHCIMFSEHHKQQAGKENPAENSGWPHGGLATGSAAMPELCGGRNSFYGGRRNSHQAAGHPSSQCQQQYQQYPQNYYQPQAARQQQHHHHQMRPSASSTSMLQAAAAAAATSSHPAYSGRLGRQLETPNGLALVGEEDKSLDEAMGTHEGTVDWLEATDNQLVTKIQDMQTLFQVNRLIIDRSILLLLSASKCCLRQGNERLRGLEARLSIVVQIRASVSIIMAIVKCSIFGGDGGSGVGPKELPITAGGDRRVGQPQQQQQQAWPSSTANLFPGAQSQSVTNSGLGSGSQRDNQFDNYYYLACLSPFRGGHNNISGLAPLAVGAKGLRPPLEPRSANWGPPHGALNHPAASTAAAFADLGSHHKQQQQQLTGGQANKKNLNLTPNNKGFQQGQQIGGSSSAVAAAASSEWPLQIMNYFLQTWNGAQSAHDAISKLQLLVRPLACVNQYKSPFEALDDTIDIYNRIQATTIKSSQEPSSADHHIDRANATNSDNPFPDDQDNKENKFSFASGGSVDLNLMAATSALAPSPNSSLTLNSNSNNNNNNNNNNIISRQATNFMLMNKRQLINTLNSMFLGDLKANLIERAHEFTDCAYTKHEHRETIVLLIHCIKMQLNKLVKLLYRLRRKAPAISELNLSQLRQLATQLDETCAELKCELQTIVIEQSDELDKFNSQLDLIKQLKHHCLVGDFAKTVRVCSEFHEQSEQLIEICKMLNQVSPTNKMKISTKTLAIWFELNIGQLLQVCQCLAQNHRSRVLKDCAWAYIQVWCSFYDDFCQLARQLAYLTHAQCDTNRTLRVASLRDQILSARQSQPGSSDGSLIANYHDDEPHLSPYEMTSSRSGKLGSTQDGGARDNGVLVIGAGDEVGDVDDTDVDDVDSLMMGSTGQLPPGSPGMGRAASVQSLNMVDAFSSTTDSPRSLDHYYGFGANYSRGSKAAHQQSQHQQDQGQEPAHLGALSRQSASPRLCGYARGQGTPRPQLPGNYGHHQYQQQQMTSNIYGELATVYAGHQDGRIQQQRFMVAGPQEAQANFQFVGQSSSAKQPAGALAGGSLSSNARRQHPRQQPSAPATTMDQGGGSGGMGAFQEGAGGQAYQLSSHPGPLPLPNQPRAGNFGASHRSQRHHHHHHHHRHHHYQQQQQQQQQPGHYPAQEAQMQMQLKQPPGYQLEHPAVAPDEFQLAQPPPPETPLAAGYVAAPGRRQKLAAQVPSGGHHPAILGPHRASRPQPGASRAHRNAAPLAPLDDQLASDSTTGAADQLDQLDPLPGENSGNINPAIGSSSNQISLDQQSSAGTEPDKWSDSDADAIVRGARETAQMALSMYQFTKGEGDLNTTQDLFTQAELFAEEANELYKEVRCFSYKVPAGDLKKELLAQLGTIPALVQQLQFIVKNPTVGKPATFAKVDSVIRETRSLMEAVNRVVQATLSCRQHYNMAIASMRKRTRTLSPSYRGDKGFEFENHSSARQSAIGGRHGSGGGGMGSEPDI